MTSDVITFSRNNLSILEKRAINKLKNRILSYCIFYDEHDLNKMTYKELLQLELMLFIKLQIKIKYCNRNRSSRLS